MKKLFVSLFIRTAMLMLGLATAASMAACENKERELTEFQERTRYHYDPRTDMCFITLGYANGDIDSGSAITQVKCTEEVMRMAQ